MADPEALQVDTAHLRLVAARVADVGDALERMGKSRAAHLAPTDSSWVAVAAATTATNDWRVFVQQLAASVSGIAADLRSTAEGYDSADLDSAQRFRQDRRFPD